MSDSFHEVCLIFPPMSAEEFLELKADIEANGLRDPITRHDGLVVDGRQRLLACRELGIMPDFVEWDGVGSLAAFVASRNIKRRHLSFGQRLTLGVAIEERMAIEARERKRMGPILARRIKRGEIDASDVVTQGEQHLRSAIASSRIVGVGSSSLIAAKAIKAKAPEVFEKVKSGELTLAQGRRQVDRMEKRRDLEVKATKAEATRAASGASRWEVIHGDSMGVLTKFKPGTARLVFADPPYNIGVDYGEGKEADQLSEYDYLRWCSEWIGLCYNALSPDGSFWMLVPNEQAAALELILRGVFRIEVKTDDALERFVEGAFGGTALSVLTGWERFHIRARITWYESFGVNCHSNFNRCSRRLFYCVKNPDRFVFHPEAVSRPSDRQARYGDPRADPAGKIWDDVWGIEPAIPRLVGNASERLADFPTQLPEALLLAVVGCSTDPGDLVVDPFSGSGTTGVACLKLGRRYLGSEKSAEYARVSRLRLTAAEGGL